MLFVERIEAKTCFDRGDGDEIDDSKNLKNPLSGFERSKGYSVNFVVPTPRLCPTSNEKSKIAKFMDGKIKVVIITRRILVLVINLSNDP